MSNYQGQEEVVIWEERCVTVDWTVNISGGTPLYTTDISRDFVFQKNGTSYSEQFCFDQEHEENYVQYAFVTITADVTDSAGQSRTVSDTVVLHYRWLIY